MNELEPLNEMPSSRLKDILQKLEDDFSEPSVINLDALLPKDKVGAQVLKTFLLKLKESVKTLSLRFNTLNVDSCEELIYWLSTNNTLRSLYLMGTGIDPNTRNKLEASWKKNLIMHSVDNTGMTFHRRAADDPPPPGAEAK
jgi:hypothetical protein